MRAWIDGELKRGISLAQILKVAQQAAPVSRSALSRHALQHLGLPARKGTKKIYRASAPGTPTVPTVAPPAPPKLPPAAKGKKLPLKTRNDIIARTRALANELRESAEALKADGNNPAAAKVFRDELVALTSLFDMQGYGKAATILNLPHLQGLPPTQQLSELVAETLTGRLSIEDATQVGKLVSQSEQAADAAALQRWLAAVRGGEHPLAVAYRLTQDPRLLLAARRQGLTLTAEVLPDASDAD